MWTAEQARAFSRKGAEASVKARQLKAESPPEPEKDPATVSAEAYVFQQLSRTRKQIDLLNTLIESKAKAGDTKGAKEAADAKARLYDIEAALANRPKPGQLRPQSPRTQQQRRPVLPIGYQGDETTGQTSNPTGS